jgi:glutamate 5-kinase
LVNNVKELTQLQLQTTSPGSQWGTGGMLTKISAARIAVAAGVRTVITQGKFPDNIERILQGEPLGTHFQPQPEPTSARKRWIAYGLVPTGKLYLDTGAIAAITQAGKSLLAAGIKSVEGEFEAQEAVQLCDHQGNEIARGLVNYSSQELEKIRGCHSQEISTILGFVGAETVIHRDNLVLT